MEMEFIASSTDHHHHQSPSSNIIRGKRTKRPRPSSPPSAPVTSSSSTGGSGSSRGGGGYNLTIHSPTTSSTDHHREISAASTTTEEEEDMANCLIMLATQTVDSPAINQRKEKPISSRKFTEMVMPTTSTTAAATVKAGIYVYECKTCNRAFSSFQALGGHRASHKKPKASIADEMKKPLEPPPLMEFSHEAEERKLKQVEEAKIISTAMNSPLSSPASPPPPPPPGFGLNTNKAKVHECSICGSEFLSGQALGGHMRRHRTTAPVISPVIIEKPKSSGIMLSFDLNLPAPPEDHDGANNNHHHYHRETKFQFTPNSSHLVFSAAPALIDCHY